MFLGLVSMGVFAQMVFDCALHFKQTNIIRAHFESLDTYRLRGFCSDHFRGVRILA